MIDNNRRRTALPVHESPDTGTRSGSLAAAASRVLYEIHQHVAWVTLNHRDALNAIDPPMAGRLTDIWRQVSEEDAVHTVVVTGAGPEAFSIGFNRMPPTQLVGPKTCGLGKRLVVAVNGIVCREAFHFLREADLVVCADNATFFEPRWGGSAGPESVTGVIRVRGMRSTATRRDPVTAAEASRLGVVQETVPLSRLRHATESLVERMPAHTER